MAADLDFIIEILLKARDEATPVIQRVKAEADSLRGKQDATNAERDLSRAIKDTGDESRRTEQAQRGRRTELERSKRAAEDARKGTDDLSTAYERGEKVVSGHARIVDVAAAALERLRNESKNTGSEVKSLDERMENLKKRHVELNDLSPQTSDGLNKQREAYADLDRQIKSVSNSYSRLASTRKEAEDGIRIDAIKKSEQGFIEAAQARAQSERLQKLVPASRQPLATDTAIEAEHVKRIEKEAQAQRDLEYRLSATRAAYSNFDEALGKGNLSKGEATRSLKDFSSQFSSLRRELVSGGRDLGDTDKVLDDITSKLKNTGYAATGGIKNAISGGNLGKSLEAIDTRFDDLGVRISGVSSYLTGFYDLVKIGLSQQLISGLVSLAGGLFSVVSAATQAGAALAGAFVSGIGQALPMLAIIGASVERFKSILQAVSVAAQAEQQHFFNPTEKQVTQLQNTSQLISSQQQLSNSYIQLFEAQQRVRDSQISLTEARYTAKRQITELALAEKNARLEAEGANLSLTEARRNLTVAIQQGNVTGLAQAELAVKEAELNKKKTDYEIPKAEREARLARQRGVSGAPSVISATQGLEGSKLAVTQAKQAAEAAKRQEQITKLQQAARSSHETSSESQLKFLEKSMSPTELGLTKALIGIEKELKSPDSPLKKITDYIVAPFAHAVERIRSLLKDSNFLGPIDALAKAMGAGLSRLEQTAYGKEGTSFFERMAKDASENVPVISQAIERIMKLFEDIATAAGPAFHKLSEDWDKFWGVLDAKYSSTIGLFRLEQFFNKSAEYAEKFAHLGTAIIDLFLALGHDAAPQGLSAVSRLTEGIEKATNWVQKNSPEVSKFFKEASEGLGLIGSTLFSIGKNLLEAFSLSSLKALNGFLTEILLPGLRDVIGVLGLVTKTILNMFNMISGGRTVLEYLGAGGILVVGLAKAYTAVKNLIEIFKELRIVIAALSWEELILNPWVAIGAVIAGAVVALGNFSDEQKKTKITTEEANQAYERQAQALREIKTLNDEYSSSQLSVKEAKTQVTSAEQALSKIQKEPVASGETVAEHRLRIEQDRQQLKRSIITLNEREEDFKNLPGEQREKASEARSSSTKGVRAAHRQVSQAEEELEESRNTGLGKIRLEEIKHGREEGLSSEEISKIKLLQRKEEIPLEEKLAKARENLAEKTKAGNEIILKSTQLSSQGATKFSDAYHEAYEKFEEGINKAGGVAKKGTETIQHYVNNALKKWGVTPAEITSGEKGTVIGVGGGTGAGGHGRSLSGGAATGAYIQARSGGRLVNTAEAGHDEVILTTDPRHANRQRQLLSQYFSRAPHMAAGGFVADSGTNFSVGQEPKLVTELKKLGEYLGVEIQGISGYRTPAHSVEVGGFADDPHTRGEAVDIGPNSIYPRLNPSVLSKFDLYRPFYPASPHEINHLQLLPGDAAKIVGSSVFGNIPGSSTGSIIGEINAPRIKGGGEIGRIAQASLKIAAKAANIYLSRYSSSKEGPGAYSGTLVPGIVGIAKRAAKMAGLIWNAVNEKTIRNLLGAESSGGTNEPPTGPLSATGPFQVIPSTFNSYALPGHTNIRNPEDNADAAMRYIKSRYGSIEGLQAITDPHPGYAGYAAGGIIGISHLRKRLSSFARGGIAPWGGRPVPIIAHEGERVMNPAQYSEAARMAGTSPKGLDSHLGYNNSPRQSFDTGGAPKYASTTEFSQPTTSSAGESFTIKLPNVGNYSNSDIGSIGLISKVFSLIQQGFKKLGKIGKDNEKYTNKLTDFVKTITDETSGILALLEKGREVMKSRFQRSKTEAAYSHKGNQISLGPGGETFVAEREVAGLAQEAGYLNTERKIISGSMSKIKSDFGKAKNIKNANKRATALRTLNAQYDKLKEKQRELGETIDANVEARYQAETQAIQSRLTDANTQYQTKSSELATSLSKAQGGGDLSGVGSIEKQIGAAATAQKTQLEPLLEKARATGNKELAASIKQEIEGLQQTINSSIIETISNAQTLIQRESALAESNSSTKMGLAKVRAQEGRYLGVGGSGELEKIALGERGANLAKTGAEDARLKEQAEREGDRTAVISLTEEINKNSVEIAENNLAIRDNVIVTRELTLSQIQREGAVGTGIYGAAKQGLEVLGQTTGFTNVAGMLSAAAGEKGVLTKEQTGVEHQGQEIGLNVEGKTAAQVLMYLQSPEALALISKIETTGDEAEKINLEKIISGLESNSIALLNNTEEIAKLNGSLNQPQSWSTTAWQQYRGAFFNGMGQLLPQYAAALPAGAAPVGAPVYGSQAPGAPVGGTHIGQINLTHPVQKLDPALFGEELSHHIATTPSMS